MSDYPIHQHYIWRKYLRAWSSNEQVFCLRDHTRIFPANVMKVGQERFFYRFEECTDEEIEIGYHFAGKEWRFLMDTYTLMNQTIRNAGSLFDDETQENLSVFAKTSDEQFFNGEIEERLKYSLDALYKKDFSFLDDTENCMKFYHSVAEQYFRTDKMKNGVSVFVNSLNNPNVRTRNIWFLLRHIFAAKVGLNLWNQNYNICLLENRNGLFITSDQPMVNLAADGNGTPVEKVEFYYPISPKLAIFISQRNEYPMRTVVEVNDTQAVRLNDSIAKQSMNQIFSDTRDKLERYIQQM